MSRLLEGSIPLFWFNRFSRITLIILILCSLLPQITPASTPVQAQENSEAPYRAVTPNSPTAITAFPDEPAASRLFDLNGVWDVRAWSITPDARYNDGGTVQFFQNGTSLTGIFTMTNPASFGTLAGSINAQGQVQFTYNANIRSQTVSAQVTDGGLFIRGTWSEGGGFTGAYYAYNHRVAPRSVGQSFGYKSICGHINSCGYGGDPINLATGNFTWQETDLKVESVGMPFNWLRTYNSRDAQVGLLGRGWSVNYGARLLIASSITLVLEDGSQSMFRQANGQWYAPQGELSKLRQLNDGTYEVLRPDQSSLRFNTNGQLISQRDSAGHTLRLSYSNGKLSTITDTVGRNYTIMTNPQGRVTRVIEPTLGRTLFYTYTNDLLTSMRDLRGTVTTFNYTNNLLTSIVLPNSVVRVTNSYDAQGRVISQDAWDTPLQTLSYNIAVAPLTQTLTLTTTSTIPGNPIVRVITERPIVRTKVQEIDGRSTLYDHDLAGRLVRTINPQGAVTLYGHNANDAIANAIDFVGNPTHLEYDANGNLLNTTNALGQATNYAYDAQNRLIASRNAVGHSTSFGYRPDGLLASQTDSFNQSTLYSYTTFNFTGGLTGTLLTSMQDRNGVLTRYGYDSLGRLSSITDSFNRVTTIKYDPAGRVIQQILPSGLSTCWEYNAADQRTAEIQACVPNQPSTAKQNVRTDYGYDALGRQIWSRNPAGEVTRTIFNNNNQVIETIIGCAVNDIPSITTCDAFNPNNPHLNRRTTTSYNTLDQPYLQTDVLGVVTKREYTPLGQVKHSIVNYQANQPSTTTINVVHTTEYDQAGRVIATIDPLGRRNVTRYDALGRNYQTIQNYVDGNPLTGTADSDLITQTDYDALGRVTATIQNYVDGVWDASKPDQDRKTVTLYDALSRPIATIQSYVDGVAQTNEVTTDRITEYRYDPMGNRIAQIDPLGRVTFNRYNTQNQLIAVIHNCTNGNGVPSISNCASTHGVNNDENLMSSTTHTVDGQVETSTDPAGRRTRYLYDQLGRTEQVIQNDGATGTPANITTRYGLDGLGQTVAITDALGGVQRNQYNSAGWLVRSIDPTQRGIQYKYDGLGRQIQSIDALNQITQTNYDVLGRTKAVIENYVNGITEPNEAVDQDVITSFEYDIVARQIATIWPDGRRTTYAYDGLNRQINVIENANGTLAPSNVQTSYGYDRRNLHVSTLDAEGRTWNFEYNAANWLSVERDPLGRTWSTSYNRLGQIIQTSDPRQFRVNYGYDQAGRNIALTGNQGLSVSMRYDLVGRRTSMNDITGNQTFQYNDLDLLTSTIHASRNTVTSTYDTLGRRTELAIAGGATQTYSYDAAGRMDQVFVNGALYADGDYDALGRLAILKQIGIAQTTYKYDHVNRITGINTVNPSNRSIANFAYQFNRMGQVLSIAEQIQAIMIPPTQIGEYRVYAPLVRGGGRPVDQYTYDGIGRLIKAQTSTGSFSYGYDRVGNRISENNQTYSYNAANQRNGWTYDAAGNLLNDGQTSATYDELSRLTSMNFAGNNVQYHYTGDGILAAERINNQTAPFVLDRANRYAEQLGRVGGNSWIYRGYGVELGNSANDYFIADRLASIRGVIKPNGTFQTYQYTPFGVKQSTSEYGFTGEYQRNDNSAVYLRARWYNPNTGVFFSKDPYLGNIGQPQSLHRYSYVHNDPLNNTDPSGNLAIFSRGFNAVGVANKVGLADDYGMYDLATQFEKLTPTHKVIWTQLDTVLNLVRTTHANNPEEPIILVGHSRGGAMVLEAAHILNQDGIKIDFLATFGMVDLFQHLKYLKIPLKNPDPRGWNHDVSACGEVGPAYPGPEDLFDLPPATGRYFKPKNVVEMYNYPSDEGSLVKGLIHEVLFVQGAINVDTPTSIHTDIDDGFLESRALNTSWMDTHKRIEAILTK